MQTSSKSLKTSFIRGGSIGDTVVHSDEFVGVVSHAKGGPPFVPFGYADQVVSAENVHLG